MIRLGRALLGWMCASEMIDEWDNEMFLKGSNHVRAVSRLVLGRSKLRIAPKERMAMTLMMGISGLLYPRAPKLNVPIIAPTLATIKWMPIAVDLHTREQKEWDTLYKGGRYHTPINKVKINSVCLGGVSHTWELWDKARPLATCPLSTMGWPKRWRCTASAPIALRRWRKVQIERTGRRKQGRNLQVQWGKSEVRVTHGNERSVTWHHDYF